MRRVSIHADQQMRLFTWVTLSLVIVGAISLLLQPYINFA